MGKTYIKGPFEHEDHGNGWWYGEFEGEWVSRQIEVYPDAGVALVGGRDIGMADQPLPEWDDLVKQGVVEITSEEFDSIWEEYA